MRDPSEVIAVLRECSRYVELSRLNTEFGVTEMLGKINTLVAALSTPQPAAAEVDDAMVERALQAFHGDGGNFHHIQWTADQRRSMRAALLAAIKGDSHAG